MRIFRRQSLPLLETLAIAILLAFLFIIFIPASIRARQHSKDMATRSMIRSLMVAIRQYRATYGYLPVRASATDTVLTVDGVDGPSYSQLIEDLSCSGGKDNVYNPKNIKFLQAPTPGHFGDTWGQDFVVVLDTNYDKRVDADPTRGPFKTVYANAAIWSVGRNGVNQLGQGRQFGKGYDDVNSWDDEKAGAGWGKGRSVEDYRGK
jgi:type II secretory pathway pseudopilin PulG